MAILNTQEIGLGRYLTTTQIAAETGINSRTVRLWAKRGILPSVQHGKRGKRLFRLDDVKRALAAHNATVTAAGGVAQ